MGVIDKFRFVLGRRKVRRALMGYLFASPWLIGFSIFTVYAIISVVYYSFTDFPLFKSPLWIGVENYIEMFKYDELFPISLFNTVYYVVLAVPIVITVAFLMALYLNQRFRGRTWFRMAFYMPAIVPVVAMSVIWRWILNPNFGILNWFLGTLGIRGPNWLGSTEWAKPSIILMNMWYMGPTMVIFLAGLQDIPQQLYEAAEIDGAGRFRKLINITIPMMTPTILFNLIIGIIGGFQVFTQAFVMTSGGPGYATLFYQLYLYQNAFQYLKMGYASSLALMLLFIVLALTLLVLGTSGRWVYYEQVQ
ncbi:MAG: carbohydrate ABC transporter permease [bacterium]